TLIGREGICARAGHHCCQPLIKKFGRQGTTRASFYLYNTKADVDALVSALKKAREVFKEVL
ncbi:MAG: aminotransferase class V-fold PLP-dependent enzyme, partial [Candidatus Eremiobacteraeota bacterium]|nr:aminotransferase class V-fold PLP-dependent enzyme [Candidatus Eremiobacteraeota bacterium]